MQPGALKDLATAQSAERTQQPHVRHAERRRRFVGRNRRGYVPSKLFGGRPPKSIGPTDNI